MRDGVAASRPAADTEVGPGPESPPVVRTEQTSTDPATTPRPQPGPRCRAFRPWRTGLAGGQKVQNRQERAP